MEQHSGKSLMKNFAFTTLIAIVAFSLVTCGQNQEELPEPSVSISPNEIFDNLTWRSESAGTMYLEVSRNIKIADPDYLKLHLLVFLKTGTGTDWTIVPFVSKDQIYQTEKKICYTVDDSVIDFYDFGGPVYIYAKQNSGIDFNMPAAAGTSFFP
jgi:hypothetical protein